MNKWADFGISEVKYNADHSHIVKVRAHPDNGDTIGVYAEISRQDVIANIKANITYVTITKGTDDKWKKGQSVYVITINGQEFIKTVDNGKESDNLENLPEF